MTYEQYMASDHQTQVAIYLETDQLRDARGYLRELDDPREDWARRDLLDADLETENS